VFPFPAQNDLEVRHGVTRHFAADAVKAQIGHMVLSATVEAAADFDVEFYDGIVQLKIFLGQSLAQLRRQSA